MFLSESPLLFFFILGVIISLIGIGLKDHNPGVVTMGVGLLIMIYVIIQKAIEVFGY